MLATMISGTYTCFVAICTQQQLTFDVMLAGATRQFLVAADQFTVTNSTGLFVSACNGC